MMRVIAGEFRGRRITAPEGLDTRPTADRVKESMMSAPSAVGRGSRPTPARLQPPRTAPARAPSPTVGYWPAEMSSTPSVASNSITSFTADAVARTLP